MFTFQDQVNQAKEISGLVDATSVVQFKRDINRGASKLTKAMGRTFNCSRIVTGKH